ncbi:MetQ/NlpA family ABC transporter substrate-binding protein [Paenibacillus sp. HJGM_3]|uniref:MetQ/NlpA family ABC transporter substrate-binding protein n=1 Tax=Paenibacillus sp. HJGM_3 TaxID=3379816 RepID=UPI00385BB3A4
MMRVAYLGMAILLMVLTTGCAGQGERSAPISQTVSAAAPPETETIKLVLMSGAFQSQLAALLREELEEEGYALAAYFAEDILEPNKLVDEGKADANFFQHEAYFNQFVSDHNLKQLVRGFYVVSLPGGLYSRAYPSLAQLPDGATVSIPVDATNNGRALLLLQKAGLLQLKPGVEVSQLGLKDIVSNPRGFKFKEVTQPSLPQTLEQSDAGFLFAGSAVQLGYELQRDALALEADAELPYKSIVAVRRDLAGSPKIRALQRAFASEAVKALYKLHYDDAVQFLDERGGVDKRKNP